MAVTSARAALNREPFAAPVTAALQNRAAASRAHPLAEPVNFLPAAIVGLERALHVELPLGYGKKMSLRYEPWSLPNRAAAVKSNRGSLRALSRALGRLSRRFSLRPGHSGEYCAARVGSAREPQARAPSPRSTDLPRADDARTHPGKERCEQESSRASLFGA